MGFESAEALIAFRYDVERLYLQSEERPMLVQRLRQTGVLTNYEIKLKRRDGVPVWLLVNARLTRDSRGRDIVEGMALDNTARRTMEEELRQSEENFRWMAVHDDLTGLYNTRYLYRALEEHLAVCRTEGQPLSLIFMDLDHFKHIVDTYGHLNGSQVIAQAAETVTRRLTEPEFGVAYGGDEFVLVLPGVGKKEAFARAEQIRSDVAGAAYLSDQGLNVRLTASLGVATFPDDAATLKELLGLADRALFRIKETGKNAIGGTEQSE